MWMAKIEPAMALARMATGTVSRISVLTGPVARKRKNIEAINASLAAAKSWSMKAANATGTAASELSARIHA